MNRSVAGVRMIALAVALLALFGAGAALRWRLLAQEHWVNPDEGTYLQIATSPDERLVDELIAGNAHPPLYYRLLRALARCDDRFERLRFSSFAAGVLAMLALAWLGFAAGGRGGLVMGALLGAMSRELIVQSCVLRPYALQVLMLAVALAAGLRWTATHRARFLLVASGAMTCAVWLQYQSIIIVSGIVLTMLGARVIQRLSRADAIRLTIALAPVIVSLVWLYFAHVRPSLLGSEIQQDAQARWLRLSFPDTTAKAFGRLWSTLRFVNGKALHDSAIVLALISIGAAMKSRRSVAAFIALGTMVSAAGFARAGLLPLGPSRHCLYLLPVLVATAADGLGVLIALMRAGRIAPRGRSSGAIMRRWGGAALLVAIIALGTSRLAVVFMRDDFTPFGDQSMEFAFSRSTVRAVAEALATSGRTHWVTDLQTHYLVMPAVSRAERRTMPRPGGGFFLTWGGKRLHVAPTWTAPVASRESPDRFERLLTALEDERLFRDGRVGLILGGWDESIVWRMARDLGAESDGAGRIAGLIGDEHLALAVVSLSDLRAWRARQTADAR
jgi:hypothetical protein